MRNVNPLLTSIGYKAETLDEIRLHSPAAFATQEKPTLSNRYSFVPTYELLQALETLNWHPTHTRQCGLTPYTRHIVRLSNPDLGFMDLRHDKVKPQIILDNSHNGSSPAQMHMGLFRLVCTNGLIVAMPGMFTSIKLRHIGIEMTELKQLMEVVANQYTTIGQHIGEMQQFVLNQDQKEDFVIRSMVVREPNAYIKEDGTIDVQKITTRINPIQILDPIRGEDRQEDLWTVFNLVQERLVKGEFEKHSASGRNSKPRGISNAARNIDFNIKLWELAESFMAEKAEVAL